VSSGLLRRVALVRNDVSEEPSASAIRVTRICELGTTFAVTSNRRRLRACSQVRQQTSLSLQRPELILIAPPKCWSRYASVRLACHPVSGDIYIKGDIKEYFLETTLRVRFEVFTAVTMKNVAFWDIRIHFVLHRRHITSPLQGPAS
jgi:hypothetical protein